MKRIKLFWVVSVALTLGACEEQTWVIDSEEGIFLEEIYPYKVVFTNFPSGRAHYRDNSSKSFTIHSSSDGMKGLAHVEFKDGTGETLKFSFHENNEQITVEDTQSKSSMDYRLEPRQYYRRHRVRGNPMQVVY